MNNRKFEEILDIITKELGNTISNIPVGISNRHVHLSKKDIEILFGKDYELTCLKDLSQPGQFASKETVVICGPKGSIEKVRILGPLRDKTQVEILKSDTYRLGIDTEVRISGDLKGTSPITLIGTKGSVYINEGLIIAQRHIHMNKDDAKKYNVINNQNVDIEIDSLRGGILKNVIIRVTNSSSLELHLDMDEANALGISSKSRVKIKK